MNTAKSVSWWDVLAYVMPTLEAVGEWPTVGTPAWCLLPDGEPVKLAAIYDAAQHWALRLECCQEARAQASRDIASSEDWNVAANRLVQWRGNAYIPRAT